MIVDTGSNDNTVSIAQDYSCRILHHPWNADFSTPRNLGLDQAQSDWILYIDADERLSTSKGQLGNLLPKSGAAAVRVKFFPRSNSTPYAEYRIFRNDPRIRFIGKMHESMRPGISQVCQEDQVKVVDGYDIFLTHLGYEGDQSAKNSRNIPLLEQAILDVSDRVYLRYHLGVSLEANGDGKEAVSQLIKGIELAEKSHRTTQVRIEGSMCAHFLARNFMTAGDTTSAMEVIERGLQLYANNLTLYWIKARCLLIMERQKEAIDILNSRLDYDSDTFFDPAISYDKKLFGEDKYGLLGSAWFKLGDYAKAARCYDLAAQTADNPLEFNVKSALSQSRLKTSDVDMQP